MSAQLTEFPMDAKLRRTTATCGRGICADFKVQDVHAVYAELRSRPQVPSSMHFEQNDERSVTVVSVLAETQRI